MSGDTVRVKVNKGKIVGYANEDSEFRGYQEGQVFDMKIADSVLPISEGDVTRCKNQTMALTNENVVATD